MVIVIDRKNGQFHKSVFFVPIRLTDAIQRLNMGENETLK